MQINLSSFIVNYGHVVFVVTCWFGSVFSSIVVLFWSSYCVTLIFTMCVGAWCWNWEM